MISLKSVSLEEFLVLVDRRRSGTPAGRGWGVYYNYTCRKCKGTYTVVAIVGSITAFRCPKCYFTIPVQWAGAEKCDGAWLQPVGTYLVTANKKN